MLLQLLLVGLSNAVVVMSNNRVTPINESDVVDMTSINAGGVAITGTAAHKGPTKAIAARRIFFSHHDKDYPCCFSCVCGLD